jgi:pilus assembly protein CpaB
MLGLAVVLAGASVFLARNWIQEQARPVVVQQAAEPENTVTVVVAKDRLTFGNTLRKEQLRLVKWPGDAVPEGAFTSIEAVVGEEERVVLRSIEVNEPVLQNKLSGFGGKASLAAILSPEMRAVTIRVNDVAGVAGFVLPGDRVDILLTRDRTGGAGGNAANNLITDVLLQNVKVLGIDQDANEDKEKPSVAKAVTLEVSPQQAQKLALASQLGSLALMLRNITDAAAEQVKTVSTRDLSVGEANDPPTVAEAPKKKTPVKVVAKAKEDPLSAVRIVRGTDATSYEVQPDLRPMQALTPPSTKLAPAVSPAAESGSPEAAPITPAGPTFVKPQAAPLGGAGQETETPSGPQQAPISLLPPELKASLN